MWLKLICFVHRVREWGLSTQTEAEAPVNKTAAQEEEVPSGAMSAADLYKAYARDARSHHRSSYVHHEGDTGGPSSQCASEMDGELAAKHAAAAKAASQDERERYKA